MKQRQSYSSVVVPEFSNQTIASFWRLSAVRGPRRPFAIRTGGGALLSFCAFWFLFLGPLHAGPDKVGYIFTGRFYLDGPDPLGLHGAHFVFTAAVDSEAEAISFRDEGDNQGTAVYPSESCLTIWGDDNPALNITYLPWEGAPDTLTAAWHHHSFFDYIVFNAKFLLDNGSSQQLISMPTFYLNLNYDCIYSLPCVPFVEWVYWDPYDLYGSSYSASDVFGRSVFLRADEQEDGTAILLQYVVDAVAQLFPEPGTGTLDPLWTDGHSPVFEAVNPPYYGGVAVGPVDLSLMNSNGEIVNKNLRDMPGAVYLETTLGIEGSPADFVLVFNPVPGTYDIQVVPEEWASAEDAFSLVRIDRGELEARVNLLAGSQKIGAASSFFYSDLVGVLDTEIRPRRPETSFRGRLPRVPRRTISPRR